MHELLISFPKKPKNYRRVVEKKTFKETREFRRSEWKWRSYWKLNKTWSVDFRKIIIKIIDQLQNK